MKENMKKSMEIKDQKQAELISDPICLSIINLMEEDKVTKKYISDNLEEEYSLISKYIDRLSENNIIKKFNDDGEIKYQKSAESYTLGDWTDNFNGNAYNHWALGLLHHIESNLTDLLKILPKNTNEKDLLEELGYANKTFRLGKLYLSKEEVKEFNEMLTNFVKKHQKRPEGDFGEKRPYEFSILLNPDIPYLKKKINKKKGD